MPNPQYVSYPFILTSKGLNSRNTIDRIPDHQYYNLDNAELRQENSIASRLGRQPVSADPEVIGGHNAPLSDPNVHTLARLKGLNLPYRYAGAGTNIYRGSLTPDEVSSYITINGSFVLSGNRFSTANYRPTNSSTPYIFFADSQAMVKDNGSFGTVEQWGIFPPTAPPVLTLGSPLTTVIDNMNDTPGDYTFEGFTGVSSIALVNTTLNAAVTGAPGVYSVAPVSMTNIIENSTLTVGSESGVLVVSITNSTFTAFFQNNHSVGETVINAALQGTSTTGTSSLQRTFSGDLSAANYGAGSITIGMGVATPADLVEVTVAFNTAGGSFTFGSSAGNYIARISTGLPVNTGYQELTIPLSSFTAQGVSGTVGHTWANITDWYIAFVTTSSMLITIGDFSYINGEGGNVTGTGAVPYDYRITFYNMNTGDESGPSVVLVPASYVSPVGQPVIVDFTAAVTPPPPIDPQITHIRIYRRGGTLPNQWLQVGQVPIGTDTFTDILTDEQIATANILDVDTAPPVTSTLSVPLDVQLQAPVLVGENSVILVGTFSNNLFVNQMLIIDPMQPTEETVIVQAVNYSTDAITAYFQYPHLANAIVQASTRSGQPCNIATIAFNRAWIAGDPNNPDILYYSDVFNPESFPVENFIEIGSPSDPIMAVMEWNGQLYVFTQNTVWNILGAQEGSTAPVPFKTAAKHGLQAQFGWCIAEGEIYYQSFGGVYAFQGSDSRYASPDIEWIFTAQFIEDDIQRVVILMDPTQISQTLMVYYQNEIYVSYVGEDGNRHRVIWDKVHSRYRNDDVPANSMLVQDDVYTLIYGDTAGMIWQDRIGNYDTGGVGNPALPISFNVQTAALDMGMPKNFKNFNEFTIDIDTGGLPVTINLLFDYGLTIVALGTVTTTGGRGQFEFNINNGDGQLSLNVSVQLTATITTEIPSPIEVYEIHIRATPEAELRQSYDSYIMDFGSPDYKFVKQGWFEYMALDAGGITFNCYVGGSATPTFTFGVPQSLTRTSKRVRFPATKGRIWRWVATSDSPFRLYSDSRLEWKMVTQDKGYQLRPLQQEAAQQP